ncbi:MAG: hypothetical protein KGY48_02660 [Wenzhouxiangellaceae bacterium]|nr:hypothetical protein [Wenzhouxiangellaceae bacterium]MBS3746626.1 hypothetical protein [Wenzhouxiangellaceae bacterium]
MSAAIAAWFAVRAVSQPLPIRSRKPALYHRLGYVSLLLAPLVVAAFFLTTHSRLGSRTGPDIWPIGRYILYLQLSLFGLLWLMGMLKRKRSAGRYTFHGGNRPDIRRSLAGPSVA